MRLTTDDRNDPDKVRLVTTCKIFLDDVEVKGCTVADEEAGYIERYIDVDRLPPHADDWPIERVHGKVKIVDTEKKDND